MQGQVAEGQSIVAGHLTAQNPRRQRLVKNVPAQFWVLRFKSSDEPGQHKKLVASNKENQLRIGGIAM
jgi:hypothetical protein